MAASGFYERIYLDKTGRFVTGQKEQFKGAPDMIGGRKDGRFRAVEVDFQGQRRGLQQRARQSMNELPQALRGDYCYC
jgi:hypothetical protein